MTPTNPATLAKYLSKHTQKIAKLETAAECYNDITQAITTIERLINRPIPDRQLCGKCPQCDLALYAPRAATEIQCPQCKTTHNIEKLFDQALNISDNMSFTISQLHRTILPAVREYVEPRTLRRWFVRGRLVPTGYDAEGEPRFLLADVRRLRDAKPQTKPTGAAAKKYKQHATP